MVEKLSLSDKLKADKVASQKRRIESFKAFDVNHQKVTADAFVSKKKKEKGNA